MLPIIFSIGSFHLYTYVIFLVVALYAGLFVIWKRGREAHFDETEWFGGILTLIGIGVLSARVGYSLLRLPIFNPSWSGIVQVLTRTGFSSFGGLVGAVVYFLVLSKKRKWDFWAGMDVVTVGMTLMMMIAAIGAFIGGTGYGLPTNLFFGVYFSGVFDKRIPVQIFEALWYGVLFGYLWKIEASWRTISWYKGTKSEAQSGFIVSVFAFWTGLGTLLAALMRSPESIVLGVRTDILLPLSLMISGLVILHFRSGLGLNGIVKYFLKEWGLAGGLVDNWQRRKTKEKYDRLKLGTDIF